jgi:hypothetical protein
MERHHRPRRLAAIVGRPRHLASSLRIASPNLASTPWCASPPQHSCSSSPLAGATGQCQPTPRRRAEARRGPLVVKTVFWKGFLAKPLRMGIVPRLVVALAISSGVCLKYCRAHGLPWPWAVPVGRVCGRALRAVWATRLGRPGGCSSCFSDFRNAFVI